MTEERNIQTLNEKQKKQSNDFKEALEFSNCMFLD